MAKDRYAPKTLDDLMSGMPNKLSNFSEQSQQLSQLQQLFEQSISAPMAKKCKVANYRDNILVIETDSAAVAMRLNYMKMSILSEMRQQGLPGLSQIKVLTNPKAFTKLAAQVTDDKRALEKKDLVMSEDSANALLEVAKHAPPSLQQKLQRLARHSNKNKS